MCRKGQYECTGTVSMSVQEGQYECTGKVSMSVKERSV